MNRFRRSKGWLSLWLIVALLGHFGLSHQEAVPFVLCFEADGHVAVEPADNQGACIQGPKAGESPCLDIPVVSGDHGAHQSLSGPQKPSLDEGLAVAVLAIIALILFPTAIAKPVFLPNPPIVDSRLVALRSVVLLN